MDREYYDQLRKTAVEVFGNYEEEQEEEEEEEDEEPEVKDDDDDGRKGGSGGDDDDPDHLELEYGSVVDVCGTKLCLSSDDGEILEKARVSLTGLFEHYITDS